MKNLFKEYGCSAKKIEVEFDDMEIQLMSLVEIKAVDQHCYEAYYKYWHQ